MSLSRRFAQGPSYARLIVRIFGVYLLVIQMPSLPFALSLQPASPNALESALFAGVMIVLFAVALVLILWPGVLLGGLGFDRRESEAMAEASAPLEVIGVSLVGLALVMAGLKKAVYWSVAYGAGMADNLAGNRAAQWLVGQWPEILSDAFLLLAGGLLVLGPGKVAGVLRRLRGWRPGGALTD